MNLKNKNWYIVVENQHEQMPIYKKFFDEKRPNNSWIYYNGYTYGFFNGKYLPYDKGIKLSFEEFKKYILKEETNNIIELW